MIDNIDLYQVIKRLRGGDIEPIGETYVDSKRLDMQHETQALIEKLIQDIIEIAELESFAGSIEEARDEAIVCLTNIKDWIEEVDALSDGSEIPNKWIPCSEKMPKEEKKSYWICTDYGHQCECRWTNVNPFWTDLTTDWHWHHMDVPTHQKVVAWMPLPEPYKAESEE